MQPGRNAKLKRKRATVTALLLVGAAFLAAAPAGAISLSGWGAGQGDALWGLASGGGSSSEPSKAEAHNDMSGSASAAAEGAANLHANPPDPQPVVDEAGRLVAQAQAEAEGQANALLAQKDSLAGQAGAEWGIRGGGDGAYDVILGGVYDGGSKGTLSADGGKRVQQRVDARGHEKAAAGAKAEAEGALDGVFGQFQTLYNKLHASFDVGLDGAAQALGGIGMDVAGLFGFQKSAEVANVDSLHLGKRVDVAAPAMTFERPALPDVQVPSLAIDQGGQASADAAATAQGLIQG